MTRHTSIHALAKEAEKLQKAYMARFLVEDTKAWEEFCFANSDLIVKALKKAAEDVNGH